MRHSASTSAGHAAHDLVEAVILDGAMIDLGPVALAQPDQHHFHQAAFDLAGEVGVRLDPAANQHVVGLEGMAVEVHRKPFGALRQTMTVSMLERIGQPSGLLGDAVRSSTCRCPSAVPPPWLPIAATMNGLAQQYE